MTEMVTGVIIDPVLIQEKFPGPDPQVPDIVVIEIVDVILVMTIQEILAV
jgi:hypothetical protein